MLVNDYRLLVIGVVPCFGAFGPTDAIDAVDVVVFCLVDVLLNWVIVIRHQLDQRLVLIVFSADVSVDFSSFLFTVFVKLR